jgi:hypothetical protein
VVSGTNDAGEAVEYQVDVHSIDHDPATNSMTLTVSMNNDDDEGDNGASASSLSNPTVTFDSDYWYPAHCTIDVYMPDIAVTVTSATSSGGATFLTEPTDLGVVQGTLSWRDGMRHWQWEIFNRTTTDCDATVVLGTSANPQYIALHSYIDPKPIPFRPITECTCVPQWTSSSMYYWYNYSVLTANMQVTLT